MRGNQLSRYGAISTYLPLTLGKVFFVVNPLDTWVGDMESDFPGDRDGEVRVFTTIQAALDACVANRDDYVIVMPSNNDYDITAAITMTKNRVHLICPAGLGTRGFPTNAARVHQNTAETDIITVTGDCVEIAGFFFKGYLDTSIVNLSGTRWHAHIHDNFFGLSASSAGSANYGVYGTGACSHFSIHDNYFTNYSPGAMSGTNNAVAAFIGITNGSSTRGLIRDNIIHTGGNTTVAAGILCAGYAMTVINNYIYEDTAFGGTDAGVFTLGISASVDTFIADNRIAVATAANAISGGTADHSCSQNFEAENGGTVIETA